MQGGFSGKIVTGAAHGIGAAFLASDECSFMTGHVSGADGGFTVSGLMGG